MKIRTLIIVGLAAVVLAGCSKPLDKRFDSFVAKTEAHCDNYSADDWQKSIDEYHVYLQEYQDNYSSLTKDQKDRINNDIGKYTGILMKQGINAAGNAVQGAIDSASSFLRGVLDSVEKEDQQ